MIQVRTSYFNSPKIKQIIKEKKYIPFLVSIARYNPAWLRYIQMNIELAPSVGLLCDYKYNGLSHEEYTKRYISEVTPIVKRTKFTHGTILLCYETTGEFCHRHILAKIIHQIYPNVNVEEL